MDEDMCKTSFRTNYVNYEFVAFPFGITNAPATFMCLMNNIFHQYVDKFVLIINDIHIYSKNIEEQIKNL